MITIRKRFGTSQWEVIYRYGYRESLLAIRETKEAAQAFAAEYAEVMT